MNRYQGWRRVVSLIQDIFDLNPRRSVDRHKFRIHTDGQTFTKPAVLTSWTRLENDVTILGIVGHDTGIDHRSQNASSKKDSAGKTGLSPIIEVTGGGVPTDQTLVMQVWLFRHFLCNWRVPKIEYRVERHFSLISVSIRVHMLKSGVLCLNYVKTWPSNFVQPGNFKWA